MYIYKCVCVCMYVFKTLFLDRITIVIVWGCAKNERIDRKPQKNRMNKVNARQWGGQKFEDKIKSIESVLIKGMNIWTRFVLRVVTHTSTDHDI